ncbi:MULTISPECIES: transporter substrate-binding domain-containing protein [Paenibacillus]|jgi:L-cystine transport system substrate-binding protein|uniref:Amino acid ABC transporter substrate-binding protein n=2 Tax=Paenibacillus TaxID=44249 RepID=A0A1R1ECL0_9BACL|nr:amino acid ABC transporter substrate-binding protein [Paenibacillus rhizosphaerae]OXL87368.1 L-cystine-binding protein TcyJ [Paenibacillus sp. SSG-1]RED36392.1 L-cystine transport system substrate-binding protein [Paenibacillus sp. VMFN-D1]GIO51791.1 L-cystine-binding protein TcyK [Paenibacillus cineris]GIO63431.1 L-cystine-binding protein TcyK [Paenibacillus cineris]
MKGDEVVRKTLAVVAGIMLAGVIAGCGSGSKGGETSADTAANAAGGAVKKIVVGTGTAFPKICFIDENGKLTGFDVELVREIDKRLPDYEFDIQTQEFSNLLLSLETKKIDFVAHEMEKNPERTEKYLFNKEPYAHWRNKIIVAKDNDSIHSLDDLKGKKVLTGATSAEAQILENYNKEHDNAIQIVYQNGAANDTVNQITTGRVDATIGADFSLPLIDPQGKLKVTGDDLSEHDILFVFRKDDPEEQKLADAVDGAIKELKQDGTLGKLSKEWLGSDFTADK